MSEQPLGLFAAYGVELEYMIVDDRSLSVQPIADELLRDAAGSREYVSDVEHDDISWSNELVAHVIELKTTAPATDLANLPASFQREVGEINRLLAPRAARLLPSAMHPWMDPARETRLWPHDNSVVYQMFDRVFGCQGHGWSNLQSVHLNLPFAGDEEFGRLHAAIRLLLPILPALAASSPLVEGHTTGWLDSRLDVYRSNSQKIPSVAGRVIPEPVFTAADYDREIFQRIYADIAPHDPDGVLQDEWLNARGAIGRFGRGTIEIRVLDVQECPRADLAICAAVVAVLQTLIAEEWTSLAKQQQWPVEPLAEIFLAVARDADAARIENVEYLRALGLPASQGCTAAELWRHLLAVSRDRLGAAAAAPWIDVWNVLAEQGPLARRILRRLGNSSQSPPRESIYNLYRKLAECLALGRML
jgi:gamma-glutamyl:cysteine ligase YbdK (ATP-grasp superfamily)